MVEEQAALPVAARTGARSHGLDCSHCGAELGRARLGKRYCSNRCRAAASRNRVAARVRKLEALIGELARVAGRP
jgi:predicted nucleic acid-binding Zn ribbon protein